MRLTGQLIALEPRAGDFLRRGTGELVSYSFTIAHILDGVTVLPVKVKDVDREKFKGEAGKPVDVDVKVGAVSGQDGPRVTYEFVSMIEAGQAGHGRPQLRAASGE